jgi:hypothetical protein
VPVNAYYSTAEAVDSWVGLGITSLIFLGISTISTVYHAKADHILSNINLNIGPGTNNDIADKYAIKTDAYSFKNNQREDQINVSVVSTVNSNPVDINDVQDIEWSFNAPAIPYIRLSHVNGSATNTIELIQVPTTNTKVIITVAIICKDGTKYFSQFAFEITVI